MAERLLALLERFPDQAVLIVGDVMLDRYWWGTVTRTSPEAPVPVVRKRRCTDAAGGAANVATNVAGLGGRALLVGLVGDDESGRDLRRALAAAGIGPDHLIVTGDRPTTVKTRIIAHDQHVVRVDEEDTSPATQAESRAILETVLDLLQSVQVLVLSDYAKGVLSPQVLREVIPAGRARSIPTLVDPKRHDYSCYDGATLLVPNRLEATIAAGLQPDDRDVVDPAGRILLEGLGVGAVLITQGEAGMTLFERGRSPLRLPARARGVYDVTGAGDSVMAALSLALAAGANLAAAGELANLAGGLAVEQVGTTVVTAEQMRLAIKGAGDHRQ